MGIAGPGAQALTAVGPVSPAPAANTPHFPAITSTVEQIRQLVQCGGTMYAVGTFSSVMHGSTTYTRDNIFSFSATSPFAVTSWAPDVSGTVNSIAFNGTNCADAYIGGRFAAVNGTAASNIAEINTSTGNLVTTFRHSASGQVETLLGWGGHIIAGGYYTSVNGSSADPYMTSLDPATGRDDGFVHLHISGNYVFPGAASNATRIYNQQLSHGGTLDLVEGDFTAVGGRPRQQAFMLNLGGPAATVTGWTAGAFDQHCVGGHPFYVEAGAWSPGDSRVYFADTGFHPLGWNGTFPLTGLCDAAVAFPATQASVSPVWINYTGCYSLYSAAADTSAVYVAGHELYADNPGGCKSAGPGAVSAPGLGGLSPAGGSVLLNAAGTAGRYKRARGHGADDMLLTSAGLWVASDNYDGSQMCGGVQNLAGICFLPYP